MRRRLTLSAATLAAFAALALYATRVSGYADGAPAGFSGGFGEPSCHACHFDSDPDSGPGRLTIDGVPEQFAPGEQYRLIVTLARPEMAMGGFQLTARFERDGTQAGRLAPADGEQERVRVAEQEGIHYASHTKAGTPPDADARAIWRLIWTAPSGDGPVVFHVAANAANGDGTAEGDFIHTASITTAPASPDSR